MYIDIAAVVFHVQDSTFKGIIWSALLEAPIVADGSSYLYENDLQKLILSLEKQFVNRNDKLPKMHRHTCVRRLPLAQVVVFAGFTFCKLYSLLLNFMTKPKSNGYAQDKTAIAVIIENTSA